MVSVATLGESGFSDGPVHRTGITSTSAQLAISVPLTVMALMTPVFLAFLVPCCTACANHLVTFSVSLVSGRESLMFEYLVLLGSCQTKSLLPPSSRCS